MTLNSSLLSLFVLVGTSSVAIAAPSKESMKLFLKESLNVKLAQSCDVYENKGRDPTGPFEQIDRCNESSLKDKKSISGKVYRVVDGDTIHFYSGSKLLGIRMLGIDTPELHFQSLAQPKWGEKAKQSLLNMVQPGDVITLELDKTKCDRYGRVLGHVFKGDTNVNYEQVRRGYAVNYCITPNLKHCDAYAKAFTLAQQEGRGNHDDSCSVTPYVWRKALQKEKMNKRVMDSRTGDYYEPSDYYRIPIAYRVFSPDTE